MTNIQVDYWKLKELERSNRAQEAETLRHNKEVEAAQANTNAINYALGLQRISLDDAISQRTVSTNMYGADQRYAGTVYQTDVASRDRRDESTVKYAPAGTGAVVWGAAYGGDVIKQTNKTLSTFVSAYVNPILTAAKSTFDKWNNNPLRFVNKYNDVQVDWSTIYV